MPLFYLFSSHKGSAQLEATNIVLDPRYSQHQAAKPKPLQKPVGTGASTVYAGGASNSRANHRILDGISTFSGYGSSVFSIIGEYAAFKRNIDYRSLANTMFEERIIKGKLGQIDEFGKIWRNANNSTLVKQALNTNLPLLSRYSNVFGRTGAVLTTIDVGTSLMKAGMSDDSGKQIYYTMEGFLKTPSYIPGIFGIAWGIGFDPVIRPIWEKGAETYRDAINRGADPSIVFIMPGLGYCPPIKHL